MHLYIIRRSIEVSVCQQTTSNVYIDLELGLTSKDRTVDLLVVCAELLKQVDSVREVLEDLRIYVSRRGKRLGRIHVGLVIYGAARIILNRISGEVGTVLFWRVPANEVAIAVCTESQSLCQIKRVVGLFLGILILRGFGRIAVLGDGSHQVVATGVDTFDGGIRIMNQVIIEGPDRTGTTADSKHLLVLIEPAVGFVRYRDITAEDISPEVDTTLTELIVIRAVHRVDHRIQAHQSAFEFLTAESIKLLLRQGSTGRITGQEIIRAGCE